MKFIDLFAGLGGFHLALRKLGHHCVFASEIDDELCALYKRNFGMQPDGSLRAIDTSDIPTHDVLCAGFPCQPFSKAGEQLGTKCKLWGDLFTGHVLRVIRAHKPTFLLMENVANLERHDGGRTWEGMRKALEDLQDLHYDIDCRVLSPHRFGVPQIRERLFIVGSRVGLGHFQWPVEEHGKLSIKSVLDHKPRDAKALPSQVIQCLEAWQDFIERAPKKQDLPSFPIWTMEFGATYPYSKYDSLYDAPLATLRNHRGVFGCTLHRHFRSQVMECLPSYARADADAFPHWKQLFIRHNREYYGRNKKWIKPWLETIRQFPPSLQKFE